LDAILGQHIDDIQAIFFFAEKFGQVSPHSSPLATLKIGKAAPKGRSQW
jgi:hypothetical protein